MYQEPLCKIENDDNQRMLEDLCLKVLRRLIHEGAFSTSSSLEGFTILGPDDGQASVLEKKKRLDSLFQPADQRPKQ